VENLGNGDPLVGSSLSLRHDDAEDTIFHGSFDSVLVNSAREAEGASKGPNAALGDPPLCARLVLLRSVLSLSLVLLSGCLLPLVARLDFSLLLAALQETGRWLAFGVGALRTATDDEGLGVGELDLNILLIDAGKLAVELVLSILLADVELGVECFGDLVGSAHNIAVRIAASIGVEVVKETEERTKANVGLGSEIRTWQERHVALSVRWCRHESSLWLSASDWKSS